MEEDKYFMKWNSHHSIMTNTVLDHFTNDELVDVTLSCEGKYIRAHKLILSASSQYFKELFKTHEVNNPVIIMMNLRFDYLQYIIDYIYKGEMKLSYSEIEGILKLANDLQIKGLQGIINKRLKFIPDGNVNISNSNEVPNGSNIHDNNQSVAEATRLAPKHTTTNNGASGNDISSKTNENVMPERKRPIIFTQKNSEPKRRKTIERGPEDVAPNISQPQTTDIEVIEEQTSNQVLCIQEPEIIIKEGSVSGKQPDDEFYLRYRSKSNNGPTTQPAVNKKISPFMLFTDLYRSRLTEAYPNETFKEISLRLINMWKELSNEAKDAFYERASRENEKLKRK